MPQTPVNRIDEGALTKGQVRKLNALRKSVGDEIGEMAFAAWLSSQSAATAPDANAALMARYHRGPQERQASRRSNPSGPRRT